MFTANVSNAELLESKERFDKAWELYLGSFTNKIKLYNELKTPHTSCNGSSVTRE